MSLQYNRCHLAAVEILSQLPKKWDPDQTQADDGLKLTNRQKAENAEVHAKNEQITINPTLSVEGGLESCFWVFCNPDTVQIQPGNCQPASTFDEETTVYTIHQRILLEQRG